MGLEAVSDYWLALILGIVEGLTEFIPVSSTAHLRLTQRWLDVDLASEYWKTFAIVIQLGAILSVVVHFRTRLWNFVRTFRLGAHPLTFVAVAFLITAIPAYLLEKLIGDNLESITIIAWALIVGGVVMFLVDRLCRTPTTESLETMSLSQAVWVGLVQILSAIFPGTSRSMATIAAGQSAGMSRSTALEFSFLVGIPIMFAAGGYKLLKATLATSTPPLTAENWGVLTIGFVVSFLVAWASIAWLLSWVRRHGFVWFAVYRILLGTALLLGGS